MNSWITLRNMSSSVINGVERNILVNVTSSCMLSEISNDYVAWFVDFSTISTMIEPSGFSNNTIVARIDTIVTTSDFCSSSDAFTFAELAFANSINSNKFNSLMRTFGSLSADSIASAYASSVYTNLISTSTVGTSSFMCRSEKACYFSNFGTRGKQFN